MMPQRTNHARRRMTSEMAWISMMPSGAATVISAARVS
jgi:hypothetical protein